MKSKIKYIGLLLIILASAISSCKKDTGNYDYSELPAFKVDTTGFGGNIDVTQFNTLEIQPKITFKGEESNLSYLWRIYQQDGKLAIDTLSRERNLKKEIQREPGKYIAELQVSQKKSGLTEVAVYNVTVLQKDAFPRGMMLLEDYPDRTDLSLVSSTSFLPGSAVQEQVYRSVFSANNGEQLTGRPVQVQINGSNVYLLTTLDMKSVDASRFKVNRNFKDFFYGVQSYVAAPKAIAAGRSAYINGNFVYTGSANAFAAQVFVGDGKEYEAAPYVMPDRYNFMFYDQLNTRYLKVGELSNRASVYTKGSTGAFFNPAATGKKMLLQGMGFPINTVGTTYKTSWGIFCNPVDNNQRNLMILNEPNGPLANIDITSAPDILQANSFAAGELSSFCLYGAKNKLYRIQADLVSGTSSINSEAGFTAPSDEVITAIDILRTTNKMVFVATWSPSKSEGKLYLLNLNEVAGSVTGILKEWSGFGKILSMNLKNI